MAAELPPTDFASARLRLHTLQPGERFGRIYPAGHPDPLGFGKSKSRFGDPRRRKPDRRFGVLYLGQTLAVCFLEAVLRDRKDGVAGEIVLEERELKERLYADIEVATPLRMVDLRGITPSQWACRPRRYAACARRWGGRGRSLFTTTARKSTASSIRLA